MKPTRRPERIAMVVDRIGDAGVLRPADSLAAGRLRARGYRKGDAVFVEVRKPRNPRHHRLAHALGALVSEQVDDFHGLDAHSVLKRLQLESGAGCDEIAVRLAGQMVMYRIPRSLSFESMDEGEFTETFRRLCDHIAATYWPGLDPEEIENMAQMMPGSAA